jgi:hypothetical protein
MGFHGRDVMQDALSENIRIDAAQSAAKGQRCCGGFRWCMVPGMPMDVNTTSSIRRMKLNTHGNS